MVRKYQQTSKDREDESRGMKRYEDSRSHGGMDSGYMGMISEDHSAVANLPQEVVQKQYPKEMYQDKYELDDTIDGVDDNIRSGVKKLEDNPSSSMY